MVKKVVVEVEYEGLTFDVHCEFYPYVPATYENPSEGGYIDNCEIYLYAGGKAVKMGELFSDVAVQRIIALAEAKALDQYGRQQ